MIDSPTYVLLSMLRYALSCISFDSNVILEHACPQQKLGMTLRIRSLGGIREECVGYCRQAISTSFASWRTWLSRRHSDIILPRFSSISMAASSHNASMYWWRAPPAILWKGIWGACIDFVARTHSPLFWAGPLLALGVPPVLSISQKAYRGNGGGLHSVLWTSYIFWEDAL